MARGDGKAQRGRTRGSNVIKMAAGGNLAARDAAMGGAAVGSRAEATRSTSSGGLGASTRDGGFGGADRGYPDDRRVDLRGNPNTFTRTERTSAMTSPDAMRARLGPNAVQAMVDAGVAPAVAAEAARSINRRATDTRSILGDPNPGQRMATFDASGNISYSAPGSTAVKRAKEFYDQISPNEPNRTLFPTSAPAGTLGSFGPAIPTTRSISAPSLPSQRMTSAQDMASIAPGSVSFTQEPKFTPFAQTKAGQSLLDQSRKPLSYDQAATLMKSLPKGTGYSYAGEPVPEGFTGYPVKAAGVDLSVNVPNSAGVNTLGPKVGTFNPSVLQATGSGLRGQEQRFSPTGPISNVSPSRSIPKITPASSAAPKSRDNVVAGRSNFTAGTLSDGRRGDDRLRDRDRPRNRKKKPITEEAVTNVRHGGSIRGDGKAAFGKTKGRYI